MCLFVFYLWSFMVDSQPSQQNTKGKLWWAPRDNLTAAIAGTMRGHSLPGGSAPPLVPRRVTRASNMQARPPCVRLGVTWGWLANGNQLPASSCQDTLGCLHHQLGVSRSSLTSSAGRLTSNTPLMADKRIGSGQAGQQMGTFKLKTATTTNPPPPSPSLLLRPSVRKPGQLFSWDVKRKQVLVYGKAIKCQILDSSEPGFVFFIFKNRQTDVRQGMTKAYGMRRTGVMS